MTTHALCILPTNKQSLEIKKRQVLLFRPSWLPTHNTPFSASGALQNEQMPKQSQAAVKHKELQRLSLHEFLHIDIVDVGLARV